jgi:hypothetical protein
MATTFGSIVVDVALNLSGYSLRQDRTTHLTAPITASSTSLSIASNDIGKGLVQIDDELIWIDSYDRISNTATVPPYGRGYNGTTATTHEVGAKVTVAPIFPKIMIKKAIQETLDAVYPKLYSVIHYNFNANAVKTTYPVPADAQTIIYASWQNVGPTGEWIPIRKWRFDSFANPGTYPTGNTISIYDRSIVPGRDIQVTYIRKPSGFVDTTDVFEDTTGLPSSTKDVIVYGAAWRLLSFVDAGRLTYQSAEADAADSKLQFGSASSAARNLLALYTQRLNEESDKLVDQYPFRPHYSRY